MSDDKTSPTLKIHTQAYKSTYQQSTRLISCYLTCSNIKFIAKNSGS